MGVILENIKVVQQIDSGRTKGDVGCDRMVFAMNSNLFSIHFNYVFNKWSLDRGPKTRNPLITINSKLAALITLTSCSQVACTDECSNIIPVLSYMATIA